MKKIFRDIKVSLHLSLSLFPSLQPPVISAAINTLNLKSQ